MYAPDPETQERVQQGIVRGQSQLLTFPLSNGCSLAELSRLYHSLYISAVLPNFSTLFRPASTPSFRTAGAPHLSLCLARLTAGCLLIKLFAVLLCVPVDLRVVFSLHVRVVQLYVIFMMTRTKLDGSRATGPGPGPAMSPKAASEDSIYF